MTTFSNNNSTAAVAKRVGESAERHLRKFDWNSKLLVSKQEDLLHLSMSDVCIGEILGHGGFSEVLEVCIPRHVYDPTTTTNDEDDDTCASTSTDGEDESSSSSLSSLEQQQQQKQDNTTTGTGANVYALKRLKTSIMCREKSFKSGAIDLVIEGRILSLLHHPNIVKLHAVSNQPISDAFASKDGYFLIMDRLYSTLEDRLYEWKQQEQKVHNKKRGLLFRKASSSALSSFSPNKSCPDVQRRLTELALPVARAVEYLHKQKIIYRDIKPSNIGFDAEGTLKLFDFGLAREVVNPARRMTGNTGSLRYMAPEIARREYYDLSADVYSFGILLWQLASLEKPFEGMNRDDFNTHVVMCNVRPTVDPSWTTTLQSLITECWDGQPHHRPNFTSVCHRLEQEISAAKSPRELRSSWSRHKAMTLRRQPKECVYMSN